jgi:hypothetical protein
MVLPYKTGSRDGIDFIKYVEIGPVGVASGRVEKAIETKSLSGFVDSFAVFRRKKNLPVHPFL